MIKVKDKKKFLAELNLAISILQNQDEPINESDIQDRIWELESEVEELEDQISDLEDKITKLKKRKIELTTAGMLTSDPLFQETGKEKTEQELQEERENKAFQLQTFKRVAKEIEEELKNEE
jgi:predicted RNase H-like nuclease (RuvC/YqgF family)